MPSKSIVTLSEASASKTKISSPGDFRKRGVSMVDWARQHGFNARLVYAVIRGERKCLRGQSFEIAKELGMK